MADKGRMKRHYKENRKNGRKMKQFVVFFPREKGINRKRE